ncbi:MAG TPA: PKD domain-containing protein, partial [Thermoplasmata archaeon]|nr:PKD domain-containing protein [Thermoplasmata archaeon]
TDFRNANTAPDIYATRSTNAGSSFAANVKVNDDTGPATQGVPSLAVGPGKVQIAWADSRTSGSTSWDIYTASSPDGIAWSANTKVNDDSLAVFQYQPSIGIDARGDVFAAWLDTRTIGQDVYASVLDVVAPLASAGAGITVDQGAVATFDGSGSTDNLGIASYAWDFGDGSSAATALADHTYPAAGTYTATLTVWDYSGNAASSTTTVTVRDTTPPVVRGGGDRTVDEGQPLFFDASASTDNVGVVTYSWTFGDGSSATTATANHVYVHPGAYNVTLVVTDAAGNSATSRFTVMVRSSALLGMIQLLEGIIAALAIVLALLAWIVLGLRKREKERGPRSMRHPDAQPPAPAREGDPIDMSLPPAPPK